MTTAHGKPRVSILKKKRQERKTSIAFTLNCLLKLSCCLVSQAYSVFLFFFCASCVRLFSFCFSFLIYLLYLLFPQSLSEIIGPFLKKHYFFCPLGKMRESTIKKKTQDTKKKKKKKTQAASLKQSCWFEMSQVILGFMRALGCQVCDSCLFFFLLQP